MDDYKKVISEVVKKQIGILGPAAGLSVARKVSAVKLAENGEVLEITGDPKMAFEQVAEAYIAFSGEISRMILKSVMNK